MANKGFALYKKKDDLYILSVAYEYADTKFVGFDENVGVYKVNKLNDQQKEWIKTHDPKQSDKTKNYIFVGDYFLFMVSFIDFPKGKPYTQLPGGGGVYKETRKCTNIYELFKNGTILKAIENYGSFNEGYAIVKDIIRESIEELITTKKIKKPQVSMFNMAESPLVQENPKVAFTAVAIEDEVERNKIEKVFDFLKKQNNISEGLIKPQFKNGKLDYHMTVVLGELPSTHIWDRNKNVDLNVVKIGISNDAIALGVSGDYFSKNENQHITIAFRNKPDESNDIKKWKKIKFPFKIKGVIREYDADKNIIIREPSIKEANQVFTGVFPDQAVPAGKSSIFPKEKE